MSAKEAVLDISDMRMMLHHKPEAVIHCAFRRTATEEEQRAFVQRLTTNGGDVLDAIIDVATQSDEE